MRSVLRYIALVFLASACGQAGASQGPVVLGVSLPTADGDGAVANASGRGALDPNRDYQGEREAFERLARSGRADPEEIRALLGTSPDFRFSYETLAGDSMSGAEYRIKGPRSGAPFFEAFAEEHVGESYYVFFERGWFQTRAVDCGFQRTGMYGAQFAVDG